MRFLRLHPVFRLLLQILVVTAAYVVTAKAGLSFATVNPSTTAVWAPTGIAIASFLLLGPRSWIAVFAGAFITNITTAGTVLTALVIALGNTLEGLAAFALVRRFAPWPHTFERIRSTGLFIVFAALLAPVVSATIGVSALLGAGLVPWSGAAHVWRTWWIGDAVGAVVVAPLLLTWARPLPHLRMTAPRAAEYAALLTLAVASTATVFGNVMPTGMLHPYVCMPFLIWSAVRFGDRMTTLLLAALGAFALYATAAGFGPFAVAGAVDPLVLLQMFVGIASVVTLLLVASVREQRRVQLELQAGELRFRDLIERSFDVIVIVATDGKILFSSPSITRVLGYAVDEFLGTNRFDYIHPEDQARLHAALAIVQKTPGESIQIEFRMRHKNGSWVWLESVSTNLLHVAPVGGIVSNFRDITARKREEMEKSQFISLASHQLRTPLAMIRWAMNSLILSIGNTVPGEDRDTLLSAERASRTMADAIDTLLMLSQIEKGSVRPQLGDVPLAELLQTVVAVFAKRCSERTQSLVIGGDSAENLSVRSDPRLLQEVLRILVSNALKYSPEGSTVRISAARRHNGVTIAVEDTGMGIPAADRHHVFSPFFRAQNAVQENIDGSGLGLHLALSLARLLSGGISFLSEEGKGSVFTVFLPKHL